MHFFILLVRVFRLFGKIISKGKSRSVHVQTFSLFHGQYMIS